MARIYGSGIYGSATLGGTAHESSLSATAVATAVMRAGILVTGSFSSVSIVTAVADGEVSGANVINGGGASVSHAVAAMSGYVDAVGYSLESVSASSALMVGARETNIEFGGDIMAQAAAAMSGMVIKQSGGASEATVTIKGLFGVDVVGTGMASFSHVTAICDGRLLWEPEVTPDDIWTQQKVA